MADYCKQCSIDIFGEDFSDLAGLISAKESSIGGTVTALCEGCGPIEVDSDGVRICSNSMSD